MSEDTKVLLVGESIHQGVKAAAALSGMNMRDWTERALLQALRPFNLPRSVKDSTEPEQRYTVPASP